MQNSNGGEDQEIAFQILKQRLSQAPVFVLPKRNDDKEVYCDASSNGLGCILMKRGRVIAYASKKLKKYEEEYPTHDLELATVPLEIRVWKWEKITMDLITKLPKTPRQCDAIW
ncbi:putative reverse transcriptase domain-containing protein, partial [Tanacetum coccineum]